MPDLSSQQIPVGVTGLGAGAMRHGPRSLRSAAPASHSVPCWGSYFPFNPFLIPPSVSA